MTVRGSDGATAGRVRDIYLHDATGQLAAITVVRRQLSSGAVLIPAAAIAELPAAHAPGEAPANEDAAGGNRARRAADRKARRSPRAPSIRLRIEAAATKNGTPPPVTGHATPQELRAAAAALGVDEASAA
ncbi:PRC-barrel domain-containing protein [Brachybacterium sp. UNK5269]|uniref:PRC-barrel domain-containing protein n=1 Tax=Brachybacterium sp. UNK5269 TaxID=3408576 RepID=UPI003BB0FF84